VGELESSIVGFWEGEVVTSSSIVGPADGGAVEQHCVLEKSSHTSVPRDSNVARTAYEQQVASGAL